MPTNAQGTTPHAAHATPTVLQGIVDKRRTHLPEIHARIAHVDPNALEPSTRSLYHALGGGHPAGQRTRFIMECKSSSPSLGLIREHYQPADIARVYSRYASAISVLCEPERFGGDYDHLAAVAQSTHLPVVCKDFIISPVQVHAARYFGADAILLMLSVLDDAAYAALAAEAERLGLDVITEVIDEHEVARATRLGARIFGINHRDLNDLSIDLGRSARLTPLVSEGAVVLAESGVRDARVVRSLSGFVHAFLVGSQLTGRPDVDEAARELVFGRAKVCGLRTTSAAQVARACGATWGGLIFEPASPRNVSRETAREIAAAEPALRYVGVTRATDGFADFLAGVPLTAIQLHAPYQGSAAAEEQLICRARRFAEEEDIQEVWRAVSMNAPEAKAHLDALGFSGSAAAGVKIPQPGQPVDRIVLDSGSGGTGTAFDWVRVAELVAEAMRPLCFIAGGLNLENLAAALDLRCGGVDLNSGFEYPAGTGNWAGHKDAAALARAFEILRHHHYPRGEQPPRALSRKNSQHATS